MNSTMEPIFNEKVSVHCSQLTWSNSAAGTKKKKKTKRGSTQRRCVDSTGTMGVFG